MIVYLDNSATTLAHTSVISAVSDAMREGDYNPSALYHGAVQAEKTLNACRARLAKTLRADKIVYTSGGTEADNIALLGAARKLRRGGEILISRAEHAAVFGQIDSLARKGFIVRQIPLTTEGIVNIGPLSDMINERTVMISVMEVSNETGAVQPLAAIAELRRKVAPGALLHSDGVQGFMRMSYNPMSAGVDMYSLSAHKIHGPKGVGALALSKSAVMKLSPRSFGGGHEYGLRPGTENLPGIAGLDAAVRLLAGMEGMREAVRARKVTLYRLLAQSLPGIQVNGPAPDSSRAAPHILNVSPPGIGGEILLHALEAEGVYVGTGSACSARLRRLSEGFKAMGISEERAERSIRLSLSPFTTDDEIELAAAAIVRCHARLYPYRKKLFI